MKHVVVLAVSVLLAGCASAPQWGALLDAGAQPAVVTSAAKAAKAEVSAIAKMDQAAFDAKPKQLFTWDSEDVTWSWADANYRQHQVRYESVRKVSMDVPCGALGSAKTKDAVIGLVEAVARVAYTRTRFEGTVLTVAAPSAGERAALIKAFIDSTPDGVERLDVRSAVGPLCLVGYASTDGVMRKLDLYSGRVTKGAR